MPRRALVLALATMLLATACGGSTPSVGVSPTSGPTAAAVPIDTVQDDGTAIAEVGRATTAAAGAAPGTITATGSNGLTYSLTSGEGALLTPTAITLTPIRDVRGLDGGPPVIAAARLEPAGTVLAVPLDLAIPYSGTPAAGELVYGVISSDGGKTWEAYPARVANGIAHVAVFHFSHIALVAGPFNDAGLAWLAQVTDETSVFRGRTLLAARDKTAEAAHPAVRPLVIEWLTLLRQRARAHADPDPPAPVDAYAVLRDASDRVGFYLHMTLLHEWMVGGDLGSQLLYDDDEVRELLASVDLYLGDGMTDAIARARTECETEADPIARLALVSEEIGWFGIANALRNQFEFDTEQEVLVDLAAFDEYICPQIDQALVELNPDSIAAGDRPRVSGQVRVAVGQQFLTPGSFVPGGRFKVSISTAGLQGSPSIVEAVTDESGNLDVELSPALGADVEVNVVACFDSTSVLGAVCGVTQLASGGEASVDLEGNWRGAISGGNITSETDATFRLVATGVNPDGSALFEARGRIENFAVRNAPITLAITLDATLEIGADATDLRAVLTFKSTSSIANCEGTLIGEGTLNADQDRMTFELGGSGCAGEDGITLELAKG